MNNIQVLLVANDSVLEVARLKDEVTGDYLNAATVTLTLVDAAGVAVAGDAYPKVCLYVSGSNGLYRVLLPYTLALTAGSRYDARITVNGGTGLHAYWVIECVARARS